MVRRGARALGVALVLVVMVVQAEASSSMRRLLTQGTPDNIEVFSNGGMRQGTVFFCNAARFANSHLGARMNDRLVVIRPLGPSPTVSGRQSMGFRLIGSSSRSGNNGGIMVTTGREAQSRTVGHALGFCTNPGG